MDKQSKLTAILKATNKTNGYLKTITFDLSKIDQKLSYTHPYKIHMKRGYHNDY